MLEFFTGLILGALGTWIWTELRKQSVSFQNILHQQMEPGPPAPLTVPDRNALLRLEDRIASLEKSLPSAGPVAGKVYPFAETRPPLKKVPPEEKASAVLRLWTEGREQSEIVSRTGLEQGQVDLILALHRYAGSAEKPHGKDDLL